MHRDVNLRRYILQVFSSPNVVTFASEKARNLLNEEFGVNLNSLLRPLGVESPSKFLWPQDETFKKNKEYISDYEWQNRLCRENCPAFLSFKEVFQNKPKGSLKIWTPQNKIEEITIHMQDKEYRNHEFEVRFISLCDTHFNLEQNIQSCCELQAIQSYKHFIKQFPYNDLISSNLLHTGGKQFESMFKEFLQNDFEINVNDDVVEFNSELPLWFERWLEVYHENYNFLNYESISQPIGGIVFVDISEDDPIESIIEITNSLKTGKNFEKLGGNPEYYLFGKKSNSGLINHSNNLSGTFKITKPHYLQESYLNDFPLIYIFINDEKSNFDLKETDHNIISSFKLSFPESICYIWNIKGHHSKENIQDLNNNIVWPGTFSHPFKNLNFNLTPNRYFDSNEMEQLNSFIIDSIKNNFVPWLENTINRLCNHVIQSRKGLKNHLRILWRRPRNDSSTNSDGLLSTLGVGSTFSNMEERSQIFEHEISLFSSKSSNSNGNPNNKGSNTCTSIYYSSGSLEGQTRLVADLCLVSGIYSQSIHYYKQILSEYKLDKSFLHIGSTFFSMAVAETLSDFDLETVTDYCINSSNSFLKNNDDIGTILSIKSLLFLSLVILNSFNSKKRSQDYITSQDINSIVIKNACKSIVNSLSKISNEFQISHPNLRPRSLFSINKMDSQDHSKDSANTQYLSEDLNLLPGNVNNSREKSILSIFGVTNYVISRILYLLSSLSDFNFRIQSNPMNLSHCWSIHTAQSAQVFQDLGLFGISLKHYLSILLHMDRFKYKHIDRYLKLHSARICQKLSLFAQSTLLYSSLILDIISDKISSNCEICSNSDSDLPEPLWFQMNEPNSSSSINNEQDTEISLICYKEFIRSFVIYKQGGVSSNIQNSEITQIPSTFLKIPLPVLLPIGAVLILETDYESLFKAFGKKGNTRINRNSCTCNDKIPKILDQKRFCNHYCKHINIEVPGTYLRSRSHHEHFSKTTTSPRYFNNNINNSNGSNRNEDGFQNLLEKVNRLLDHESFLESSEAAELRSQYILRRNKENIRIKKNPKSALINPTQFSNSIRFSFIGKVCSIEFYLHNPLPFPIICESLQIWGHLRLHDGSTGITKTIKDHENYTINQDSRGTIFFEKSIILNPNETNIQKLSVIPLEAGELFLVGISFLLDGKIPIRQNFGTPSINLDRITSQFENNNNFNCSNFNKEHFGIQKINILGHSNSSSIHFGDISQNLLISKNLINVSQDQEKIKKDDFDENSSILYSGVPYTVPISISNENNIITNLKDSTLLVIPYFTNKFNIQMKYKDAPSEMSNSKVDFDSSGCIFRLPIADLQRIHEFDLTLWVNSECTGNVYFVLLNSNKSCDHLTTFDSTTTSSQASSSFSASSRSKMNRSIVFASLNFYFKNSVSMSCTVLPGEEETLNRLLLRIKNQTLEEVLIYDISAYPSKWVEKYKTELNTNINHESPKLTLAQKSNTSMEYLNGNVHLGNQFITIPPNGIFQIFLNLESQDQITFSISKINLILSWIINRNHQISNELDLTHILSGQICIYNINLFDPYSIPFHGNKYDEDKYQPLSISMNTKDLENISENSSLNGDIHLVETNVTLTNITMNSTIICSLICDSRFLTCQSLQDDLLLPLESNLKTQNKQEESPFLAQDDEELNLNRQISSALESGELKWVGPTVTHIKLDPRSSKRLKLIAVVPFKGIFSTNTIQLLVREKYPYFENYIKPENNGNYDNNNSDLFFYFSYMNWIPHLFINSNDKPISKYPIKTYQDCLVHTFSYSRNKQNYNNASLLPAYVENKYNSNKKSNKNQLDAKSSIGEKSKDNELLQNVDAINIDKLNTTILDNWLKNEESAFDNGGNIKILSNSNAYGTLNLPQKYIKRRLIVQKPHQSYFLIRM